MQKIGQTVTFNLRTIFFIIGNKQCLLTLCRRSVKQSPLILFRTAFFIIGNMPCLLTLHRRSVKPSPSISFRTAFFIIGNMSCLLSLCRRSVSHLQSYLGQPFSSYTQYAVFAITMQEIGQTVTFNLRTIFFIIGKMPCLLPLCRRSNSHLQSYFGQSFSSYR